MDTRQIAVTDGKGAWRQVPVDQAHIPCPICTEDDGPHCHACAGTGIASRGPVEYACSVCGGTGVGEGDCDFCDGEGLLQVDKVVDMLVELYERRRGTWFCAQKGGAK